MGLELGECLLLLTRVWSTIDNPSMGLSFFALGIFNWTGTGFTSEKHAENIRWILWNLSFHSVFNEISEKSVLTRKEKH